MKEIFLVGSEKSIDEVIEFVKKNNLLGEKKLFLFDMKPDLNNEYMVENGIERGWKW